jgi:hypothetical protein
MWTCNRNEVKQEQQRLQEMEYNLLRYKFDNECKFLYFHVSDCWPWHEYSQLMDN